MSLSSSRFMGVCVQEGQLHALTEVRGTTVCLCDLEPCIDGLHLRNMTAPLAVVFQVGMLGHCLILFFHPLYYGM